MYWEMKKLKEFIQTVKNFKLTKYLLDRKEGKLMEEVEFEEGLIKSYEGRIIAGKERIKEYEEEIIVKQKLIKKLETNIKKIQTVLKLY